LLVLITEEFNGEASNKWHQSVGGIWLNGLGTLTTRLTYFKVQMMKGVSLLV
jgi:hypothetical protein